MLDSLNIRNFALIEDLTIDFGRGFNVLSGETGAGKSIIIGALSLILGGKAAPEMVRSGMDMASIEALFSLSPDAAAVRFLAENGIDTPSGEIVIRRTVSTDGKSRCFINGVLSNLNILGECGALLVDVHGQHENQSLLKVVLHLALLDEFASLRQECEAARLMVRELARLAEQIQALAMDEREKARRIELNGHAINEIDAAALIEGEDADLEEENRVLNNYEKIHAAAESAWDILAPLQDQIKGARRSLESAGEMDSRLAGVAQRVSDVGYSLEDVMDEFRTWKAQASFSPERLDAVNARISLIQSLKRKYGETIPAILAWRVRAAEENESIQSSDARRAELEEELAQLRARARDHVLALSRKRQMAARDLEKRVMEELAFLGMPNTIFKTDIQYVRDPDGFIEVRSERVKLYETGLDYVEFLLSPNLGEEVRPLRKIASGGEMSRIMLALKSVLTKGGACETFVFDEVDAGIGGVTATAVGKKLRQVAAANQVLCITHLPQIAAMADQHILVSKQVSEERTKTLVRRLSFEERQSELARMLGGEVVSATTLQQAREMLEHVPR
ncbi:MAG: DNA repair protein RecN [Spirochaetota bacterium]|jgi:DNA repair protein RecN (Recombination protein N)|nr:DNA repair protein RecN [Spirochaetota bacterium]